MPQQQWGSWVGTAAMALVLIGCGSSEDPVAVADVGKQPDAAGAPLRTAAQSPPARTCPPELTSAPRLEGAPADDVLGLRPGMSWNDVEALLACRQGQKTLQTAELWSLRQNYGIPTRQLLRSSDGIPCTEADLPRRRGEPSVCDSGGGRFEPVKNVSEEFIVAFTGMDGDESARAIWRRSVFQQGQYPLVSDLVAALSEKYGAPHLRATDSGYYSMSHRPGALNLNWVYDHAGQRAQDDSAKHRCVNGPKPWFAAEHGWNSGCGLTIRAEILPAPGNSTQARELNVMVMNQRDLYASSQAFDTALRAASEAKARSSAPKPEL